jgi:7,8-dihydroneopterin aldolase/epimerase/oxygenase
MSEDRITVGLRGLEVFGRHGVHPAEREVGQPFVVDVEVELASAAAAASDDLADTLDYAALADAVARIVGGPPVALLERLAAMIADAALADPAARAVTVTVSKPQVALPHRVEASVVTLRRSR